MKHGSLFSGYEGLGMAVNAVFGSTTAWVSDIDPGACKILAHRLPDVPNLGDVTTVDWSAVEPVDVLSGGFPCQDVSHAGKRAGLGADTRTGLWSHMAYAIEQLRPAYVVAENVRGLLSARADSDVEPCPWCMGDGTDEPPLRALGAVLGDLAELGYDARWVGLRAADVGAPHGRFRIFILATDARGEVGFERPGLCESGTAGVGRRRPTNNHRPNTTPDANLTGRQGTEPTPGRDLSTRRAAPDTGGERHGRGQDTRGVGRVDGQDASQPRERERTREVAGDRGDAATADASRIGHEPRPGLREGPDRSRTTGRPSDSSSADILWGDYEPAIRRWEAILGRPAPAPTQPGRTGNPQLSPRFVEHMMGLSDGWVTDVPGLTRNQMLKALGNGVVMQQAEAAVRWMRAEEMAA